VSAGKTAYSVCSTACKQNIEIASTEFFLFPGYSPAIVDGIPIGQISNLKERTF